MRTKLPAIVNKTGNTVEWFIDGLRIATITGATFTSSNIFIGLWDSFSSLSDNTNLSFAVFDNVRVERFVTNVPPYLTAQPQGQTNLAGASVTLSVTATGTAPLCYRWQCDGNAYPPGRQHLPGLPGGRLFGRREQRGRHGHERGGHGGLHQPGAGPAGPLRFDQPAGRWLRAVERKTHYGQGTTAVLR